MHYCATNALDYNKHMLMVIVEQAKEVKCGRMKVLMGAKERIYTKERQGVRM